MSGNVHAYRSKKRRRQPPSFARRLDIAVRRVLRWVLGVLVIVTLGLQIWQNRGGLIAAVTPGCSIKGNISWNTGERIYHTPGQSYYDETRVRLFSDERWFCSEAEAAAAGFRRARP